MSSKTLKRATVGALFGALASVAVSAPAMAEKFVPTIWTDPDGCEHWVMDSGAEGFMTPNVLPNGKPVCRRGATCLVADSDQLFAVDSAVVSASGRKDLVAFFKKQKAAGFVVEGHTDSDASDAYNLALSKKRAAAVAAIAKSSGAKSVETRAYGERNPVADNGTKEGKAKNRRVEIQCVGLKITKDSVGGKL